MHARHQADLRGNILDFVNDRIILDPSKRHCQAPWSGGDGVVLVAFVAKFHERLVPEDRKRLEGLGFSLPLVGALHDTCETTSPTGPEVVASPVRGLCGSSPLSPRTDRLFKCVVGIPWSPEAFIEKAVLAGHPTHLLNGLPAPTKETLDTLAGMSMHEIGAHRASQLRKWVLKIRDVQEHEEEIRDSVPTHCLEVLERKRLAIFDELLREAGHRDTDLVQDIARGFDLSGPIPGCREFKPKLTLASMPVRELHRAAPLMREITMANTGSSGDAVLDEALYEATMKEVSKGWLAGPLETFLGTHIRGVPKVRDMAGGQVSPHR